jgi:hypothetical protein
MKSRWIFSLQKLKRLRNQVPIFRRVPCGQKVDGEVFTPYAAVVEELVDDESLCMQEGS